MDQDALKKTVTSVAAATLTARLDSCGVPRDYARSHGLRRVREPQQLMGIGTDIHDREQFLARPAARAWHRMQSAAADDGITLQVVSAFRSIEYQFGIMQRKLAAARAWIRSSPSAQPPATASTTPGARWT